MADRHGARPGRSCRRAPSPGDGIETYATKHAIRPEPPAARRRHRRENPDFSMGPEVPLEKVKATRVELDTCIMDVQATNRTLTKQIDDRDDCAKLGNGYVVRARKAQGYFGPDSTLPEAAQGGTAAGAAGPFRSQVPVAPAEAISAAEEEGPPDAVRRWKRRHPVGRGGGLPPEQHPTVVRDGRCRGGIPLPGDLAVTRELVVETEIRWSGC
jgi:hypothetical protein